MTLFHREQLEGSAPGVLDGLARIRSVTDQDGALDAGSKAVFLAAAAAAQRDAALLRHELARAEKLGVAPSRLWAAGAVLLSSRGEGAYAPFAETVHELLGPPTPEDAAPPVVAPAEAALEDAEEYLSAPTGALPDYGRALHSHAPDALVGYARTLQAAWNQPALAAVDVQLLLACVNVAGIRPDFAAHHSRLARRAGASEAQVVEAAVCAIPSGGVTAWYACGALLLVD